MPAATTVKWDSTETWQRLVAAIVASGVKLDLHEVARQFGTTYDTIQNRYRKIRAQADQLKAEVESGQRGEVVAATPKKARAKPAGTPRSGKGKDALGTVTNGRVTKTPSPKKKGTAVKAKKVAGAVDGDEHIFGDINFEADSGDVGMDGNEFML